MSNVLITIMLFIVGAAAIFYIITKAKKECPNDRENKKH